MTFRDPPPPKYFNPATLEKVVLAAQAQSTQLGMLDRELGISKTYLSKVRIRRLSAKLQLTILLQAVREKEAQMQFEDMDQMAEYARTAGGGAEWE